MDLVLGASGGGLDGLVLCRQVHGIKVSLLFLSKLVLGAKSYIALGDAGGGEVLGWNL